MHWKETVLKSEQIKWKGPRIKNIADGKLDFNIHLPLTALFEDQAKQAFAHGMLTMYAFLTTDQHQEVKIITRADLSKLFQDCGLPEIAKQIEEKSNENES